MIVSLFLAAALCLVIVLDIYKSRKMYRSIDRLLDCVLNMQEIEDSDINEGEYSALVSKVKRIQEVLGKQVENAKEEKEQVKSLVSNMSHQLKTPLANLSIYAEILSSGETDGEQIKEINGKIRKQVEKLDWIVVSLGKMVQLEQDVIDFEVKGMFVKQTILDAVDMVYEKIEKNGINFFMDSFEDVKLYHNRKWTVEVFVNILENAVKYTQSGGTIQIKVCPYEMHTEVQFIDNGCGIHEEETTQIFRRFYRSRDVEKIEGSGIGLYLSNLILEKEKGYIVVRSVYGKGSCFSVFLQNCKN